MTINFICRASKARRDGLSPIELSIIINGERTIMTLGRRVLSSKFNPATQKVRGDKDLNEYLDVIRRKCYSIETELIRMDNLNLETFIHSYKYGIKQKEDTLLTVYDKHNELYKDNVLCGKMDNAALYKYRKSRVGYWYQTFLNNSKRDVKYSYHKREDVDVFEILKEKEYEESNVNLYYSTISVILSKVKEQFDRKTFEVYRMYLLCNMSYEQLNSLTGLHDCKERISKVRKWLNDKIKI